MRLRRLKHLWQRLTRGFPDSDLWSLDCTIARFVLPRLRRFRKRNHGYPPEMTSAEWDDLMDEMIWAFEWMLDDAHGMFGYEDHNKWQADCDRAQKGLEAFGKYFMALWD